MATKGSVSGQLVSLHPTGPLAGVRRALAWVIAVSIGALVVSWFAGWPVFGLSPGYATTILPSLVVGYAVLWVVDAALVRRRE